MRMLQSSQIRRGLVSSKDLQIFFFSPNLRVSRLDHSLNWFAQLPPPAGPDDVGGSVVGGRRAWGGGKGSWGGLGRQKVW